MLLLLYTFANETRGEKSGVIVPAMLATVHGRVLLPPLSPVFLGLTPNTMSRSIIVAIVFYEEKIFSVINPGRLLLLNYHCYHIG